MSTPDPHREEAGAPDGSGPPAIKAAHKRHSRARLAVLLALLAGVVAWLAYDYAQQAPTAPKPADGTALDAAGGWWNVLGNRYLELDWEGRRATLWDYSASDSGVESTGNWRTAERTIRVEVSGAAGSLNQEYEVVGTDAELFLAPAPASTARLLDSWVADHGDEDDEDPGPGHSVSREAAWRPHPHPGHHHPHHSRSRPRAVGHGA